MIPRLRACQRIVEAFEVHPIVAILGPRQCGKTTLARLFVKDEPSTWFDLEDPVDLRRLSAPMTVLESLSGLVVLDEVQRKPDLFELVRVLVDRPGNEAPQLGIGVPAETLRRFWTMVAHYHGQMWNAAQVARSLGSSENTARRYLDILSGAYMVRVLPPWFENLRKRQVKAPKTYLRDSGILHALLGLGDLEQVRGHPKLGASWEGFALEQLIGALETRDAYYWATHGGAELDLMVLRGGRRLGFELKYADAPGPTRSMRVALADLRLDHLWVVYPGAKAYDLDDRLSVLPVGEAVELAATLR
jgi:predicted AAA+ superfamily ATPase